jgi:NitT/TauT family transport system permease protein
MPLTSPAVSAPVSSTPRQPWSRWFAFRARLPLTTTFSLGLAAWLLFLLGWHFLATTGIAESALLPSPAKVLTALWDLLTNRGFGLDILQSLKRIAFSFALALAIALPLGLTMGAFPPVESFFNALVSPLRYLPAPSFVPLLLMWLGTGDSQKITLLLLGVVFFLITLFMDNTKSVDPAWVECARTLGARRSNLLWRVIFPAALPHYVDTARQMLAVSWTYLVIAEIVAATDGIGAMMMRAKRFVKVDEIMAGILVIGLLGLACDLLIRLIHHFAFRHLR